MVRRSGTRRAGLTGLCSAKRFAEREWSSAGVCHGRSCPAGPGGTRPAAPGFSLVELLLAAAILLVILAVGAALAGQASAIWRNVFHDTHAVHDARQGLARVAEELRRSSAAVITVDAAPADTDVLTYFLPVGRDGSVVLWGAEGVAGWRVRVAVEDGRLLRTVLDAAGVPQGRPEVLATGVDAPFQGAKGFGVTVQGRLFSVRVRTRARSGGHTWRKSVATTVAVRN